MKRWIRVAVFGFLAIALVGSSLAQEIPGQGFSEVICQLGVSGSGTFELGNGQIVVTIEDYGASPGGTGIAIVIIQHGKSSSTHMLIYEDTNDDGMLDCGDTVLSVT